MQTESAAFKEQLVKLGSFTSDPEHPLGLSTAYKTSFREKASAIQAIIGKAKAHIRRVNLNKAKDLNDAIRTILAEEEEMIVAAEAHKRVYVALSKGGESDLPELLQACPTDSPLLASHSVTAQSWSVELNQLVRNSQMPGLLKNLTAGSERASALQTQQAAESSLEHTLLSADELATLIMEEPPNIIGSLQYEATRHHK